MTTLALAVRTPRSRAIGIVIVAIALALASQIAVPLPGTPVPLTLQPFVVVLAGLLIGPIDAAAAMVLYLVAGAAGAPVFAPIGPPGPSRRRSPDGLARDASGSARGSSRRSPASSFCTLAACRSSRSSPAASPPRRCSACSHSSRPIS